MDSKAGLGFSPPPSYRLKFSSYCITVKEDDLKVEAKLSVFDRIGELPRQSAFDRLTFLNNSTMPPRSIGEKFSIPEERPIARKSAHERFGARIAIPTKRRHVNKRLGETRDFQAPTDLVGIVGVGICYRQRAGAEELSNTSKEARG